MFFKRKSKAPHDPLPELAVEFRREYSFGLFNECRYTVTVSGKEFKHYGPDLLDCRSNFVNETADAIVAALDMAYQMRLIKKSLIDTGSPQMFTDRARDLYARSVPLWSAFLAYTQFDSVQKTKYEAEIVATMAAVHAEWTTLSDDVLEYAESAPIGLTADYINSLTEYRERTTLDALSAQIYAENKAVVATILNGGV